MQTPEQSVPQANPEAVKVEAPVDDGMKVAATITIVRLRNGAIQMDAQEIVDHTMDIGDIHKPLTLREQRAILEECLNFVRDQIMGTFVASYIDRMLQSQIKPDGFRKKSVFDFLKGK